MEKKCDVIQLNGLSFLSKSVPYSPTFNKSKLLWHQLFTFFLLKTVFFIFNHHSQTLRCFVFCPELVLPNTLRKSSLSWDPALLVARQVYAPPSACRMLRMVNMLRPPSSRLRMYCSESSSCWPFLHKENITHGWMLAGAVTSAKPSAHVYNLRTLDVSWSLKRAAKCTPLWWENQKVEKEMTVLLFWFFIRALLKYVEVLFWRDTFNWNNYTWVNHL